MQSFKYLVAAVILCTGTAFAQYGTPANLQAELPFGRDLSFTVDPKPLEPASPLANMVFSPERSGNEVLPALVIHHTCGGISDHIYQWSVAALQARYVVLVLDTLTPRNLKTDCGSPSKIPNGRWIKDELDAVAYLATLRYVDARAISVLGFSKGGLAATWLSSPEVAAAVRPGTPPLASVVSLYALCSLAPSRGRPQGAMVLQPDASRPLLMLLGEKDTELSPESCIRQLPERRAAGVPVEWFVYPDTTHAWDMAERDGFTKPSPINGDPVVYRYNKGATEDAKRRVFDFLKRYGQAR